MTTKLVCINKYTYIEVTVYLSICVCVREYIKDLISLLLNDLKMCYVP